jgi:DNA-binding IclR family transcriptional regulator
MTATSQRRDTGARKAGAKLVCALLFGPGTARQIAERTALDDATVCRWLQALRDQGAIYPAGRVAQTRAVVWALNVGER